MLSGEIHILRKSFDDIQVVHRRKSSMTVGHTESNDKSTCKSSIHNAFQFLQLLLLQKLCSNEYSFNTLTTRYSYHQQHKCSRKYNKNCSYQVFLGGSCNPTTWRHDQAIPYFQSRSVSYFNPQVNNWTEDLVEIEHNAKELAPLLFFVIDHDTRALASIIEVSYLAAKGRNLIVVMNDINRQNAKFLKSYNDENEQQQPHIDNDYDNVYRARKALKFLLKSINIPIFDSVNVALECAAFILDSTSRIVDENNNDSETYTEQPSSNSCLPDTDANRTQSVVVIRSLSNKIMYNSNDEFYNEIKKQIECEKNSSSQDFHRRNSSAEISQSLSQSLSKLSPMKSCPIVPSHSKKSIDHPLFDSTTSLLFRRSLNFPKTNSPFLRSFLFSSSLTTKQEYYSTRVSMCDSAIGSECDSLSPRSLSSSYSSFSSTDYSDIDEQDELTKQQSSWSPSSASTIISTYTPFVNMNDTKSKSLFKILTLPFRFLHKVVFQSPTVSPISSSSDKTFEEIPSTVSSSTSYLFDIYYAGDNKWFDTNVSSLLEKHNITYLKQLRSQLLSDVYDIHARKQCRLIYYVITSNERLSDICTELAFLIGEQKLHVVICLQYMDDNDRLDTRDINRSRKYLEDLTRKEDVLLFQSLEQSLQHVLNYFNKK